ncbi:MAG: glycosyltransferase family 2 protein [Oscillospiraceae bacterium]|nr:glycosyltransferase family 2 protein [Oscillospiraceae bacterium]
MAKISVIIPCYKAAEYIEKCLRSLEEQSFRDFDVILVDDCSPDDTEKVVAAYREKSPLEIIYLKNEKNSGPAISRNNAIAASSAEYVCFCDSDDWYDADYLEKMMLAAKENVADMVICGYKVVFADGRTIAHPVEWSQGELERKKVLTAPIDALWSVMVRRELALRFPLPDLRNGEDMAILPVWAMHARSFGIVPEGIYNYLLRGDSLSNKSHLGISDSIEKSFAHTMVFYDEAYREELEFLGVRNMIYGALLNLFKCGWETKRARKVLERFEKDFPNWNRNRYVAQMPLFKRVFVKCAAKRIFAAVWALSKVHGFLAR